MNKYLGEKGQISQRENSRGYKHIVNLQEGELNLKCLPDLVIFIQRIDYTKLNLSSKLPLSEAGCKLSGYDHPATHPHPITCWFRGWSRRQRVSLLPQTLKVMTAPESLVKFVGISFSTASKSKFSRLNHVLFFHLFCSRNTSLANLLHTIPHLKVTSQGPYLRHSA